MSYVRRGQTNTLYTHSAQIQAGSSHQVFSTLDRAQNRTREPVGDDILSTIQPLLLQVQQFSTITSMESVEMNYILQTPLPSFIVVIRCVTSAHSYCLDMSRTCPKFQANSFFKRTSCECCPDECNLDIFESTVNRCLNQLV